MPNILLLENEAPFMERTNDGFKFNAFCGKNSTLAHILAAVEDGHEVFIFDQSAHSLTTALEKKEFPVVRLNMDNFGAVVAAYREENYQLKERAKLEISKQLSSDKGYKYDQDLTLTNYAPSRVRDHVLESSFRLETIRFNQIEGINARIDPMLSSFCEKDKASAGAEGVFKWSMDRYKEQFPNFVFNCPNDERIGDKISAGLVDLALSENGRPTISTPTKEFSIKNDVNAARFMEAFHEICEQRRSMFPDQSTKIVLKPRDSAQSYGVFGFEIVKADELGVNLESLKNIPMAVLMSEDLQLLKVKFGLSDQEMKEITDVMLYVQSAKIEKPNPLKELAEISKDEMSALAKKLYDTEIQVQPLLEGIVNGDIRVNLIKNGEGKWISVGHTFRAKIASKEGEGKKGLVCDVAGNVIASQFTSCYSAGKATSSRVEFTLSPEEAGSLNENVELLLWSLNGPLKELYKDCRELGIDLIPVGNGQMMLVEINHTDPALMPISEMMYQTICEVVENLKTKEGLTSDENKFLENYGNIAQNPPYPEFKYDGGLNGARLFGRAQF